MNNKASAVLLSLAMKSKSRKAERSAKSDEGLARR